MVRDLVGVVTEDPPKKKQNTSSSVITGLKTRGRSPSVFRPDKTRDASVLNSFKNEPLEAVRISSYKDHNLYIKIITLYREY